MLTLIHGDDVLSSYKALDELKLKYENYEKIFLDGGKLTLTEIVSASDSLSLFGLQKLIVIQNFFSGTLNKEKEEILNFLKNQKNEAQIVFWEGKEVTKTILKKYLPSAKIITCQPPQLLFKFLDSLGEKPLPSILPMLHNLLQGQEAEFILSMLIRQWRYLIIASDLGMRGFSDMPSWQAHKFISQARFFNLKDLIASYRKLLSLDLQIKSGLTSYTLAQLLDIFFVSLYYQD